MSICVQGQRNSGIDEEEARRQRTQLRAKASAILDQGAGSNSAEKEAECIFRLADQHNRGKISQKELLVFLRVEKDGLLSKYFSHGVEQSQKKQQQRVRDFCGEVCFMHLTEQAPDRSFYLTEADFVSTYTRKIAIVCQSPF